MEISYHAWEFSPVPAEQQDYFVSQTVSLFKDDKDKRRLFDTLSELVLRYGTQSDAGGSCVPLPEYKDMLCVVDWPKSDFKDVLHRFDLLATEIEGQIYLGAFTGCFQKSFALYRNIRHLIVVTKYSLNL